MVKFRKYRSVRLPHFTQGAPMVWQKFMLTGLLLTIGRVTEFLRQTEYFLTTNLLEEERLS